MSNIRWSVYPFVWNNKNKLRRQNTFVSCNDYLLQNGYLEGLSSSKSADVFWRPYISCSSLDAGQFIFQMLNRLSTSNVLVFTRNCGVFISIRQNICTLTCTTNFIIISLSLNSLSRWHAIFNCQGFLKFKWEMSTCWDIIPTKIFRVLLNPLVLPNHAD